MIRTVSRAALAATSILTLSAPAFAHMVFEQTQSAPGEAFSGVLELPHGCEGAPTDTVRVTFPQGFEAGEAVEKDGWTLEVNEDTATWSGGSVPDDAHERFAINGTFASDLAPGDIVFPVSQMCGDAVLDWEPAVTLLDPALQVTVGDLVLNGAFARATLPNAPVGGGYLTITNSGDTADRLISASSPFSPDVQIHEMAVVDDVMQMRHMAEGLEIPAGETVTLAPGGLHLMFMNITEPFVEGETVPLTLTFEAAGSVEIELDVQSFGASGSHDHDAHAGH